MMKVKLSELRAMVREALADRMRFPRGPNSLDNLGEVDDTREPPEGDNLPAPGEGYGSKRGVGASNRSNHNSGTSTG
jgi:hypothetical protein